MAHTLAADTSTARSSSRGLTGDKIFLWIAILIALAFWAPFTAMVDIGILEALA